MKKYLLVVILCFFLIPNVSVTNSDAASMPKVQITSFLEPGDTEVDVTVTNYNDSMDGTLMIEIGEDTDESSMSEDTFFTVPELVKGNQIKIFYINENEKKTLLKTVTVQGPLLPTLAFTNTLNNQSESIDYQITNYDKRFEGGSVMAKVQDDSYEEYISENTGSIGLSEPFKAGTQVKLYYLNNSGEEFYVTTIKVQGKKTGENPAKTPTKLMVPSVTNRTKTFNVTYETNSTVILTSGSETYKGKEINKGQYQFTIPYQKIGARLTITATNHAGQKQTKTIIVEKSSSTPGDSETSAKLMVPSVTNRTKIFNVRYEGNSTVILKNGKKIYKGKEIKKGQYQFTIPYQKVGTGLSITATNTSGGKQVKTIIVQKYLGTTISMKDVTTKSTNVTGITRGTEIGDKVEVIIGKKAYKGSIYSNTYSVKIPKQKAGTWVKVCVVDRAGNILYYVLKRVNNE